MKLLLVLGIILSQWTASLSLSVTKSKTTSRDSSSDSSTVPRNNRLWSASSTCSLNQRKLDEIKFPRTWVPIASTYELDPDRPTPIEFLGQKYVTYQDNDNNWVVLDDVCCHRLAPLSEGRVDRGNNVIQCSYHGWEFNSSGQCCRIPQADAAMERAALSSTRSVVASYPVYVENQILFVWPWQEDIMSIAGEVWASPEGIMDKDKMNPIVATFTRDLPYGWESLVENLIDPSHVPFAHHGLQGKRTDAIPINMTIPIVNGEKGFSFEWEDRTMGLMRSGQGGFRAPYMVWYDADFSNSPRRFELSVLCIPTKPGWSRAIILTTAPSKTTNGENETKTKRGTLLGAVFKRLPVWILHILNNRFLDSDLAFLHYQEREIARQERPSYFMPAPADRCIAALRKWIPEYTNITGSLPSSFSRSELFNRYSQHTIHCKHCQMGEKSIRKWRRRTYATLVASILGFQFRIAKLTLILSLGLLRIYQKLEQLLKEGDFKHYENH